MIRFQIDDEINLREFIDGDAEQIYATIAVNRDHLTEFMLWMKPDYSIVDAREFVAQSIVDARQKLKLNFGIFRGDSFIGTIGFAEFDHQAKATEIGYWIDKSGEGKGTISRSCKSLIDYAFKDLKMNRILIRCAADNLRIAAVAERLGFIKEGVMRQSVFRNGRLHDFVTYGLLASEWKVGSAV